MHGLHYDDFLADLEVDEVKELTLFDLEAISEEYSLDLISLLFKPLFNAEHINKKLKEIKLLILDVDGVMTDGGMYWTESGDQMKKFNTKDGLGIMGLTKKGFQVGIISSGFTKNMVQQRAELLGIERCYVGQDSKLQVLTQWCTEMSISMKEVAIIGDDINDLEVMKSVGLAICPSDAVNEVKSVCAIILSQKGGQGCVREFIDGYLNKFI